VLRDFRLQTRSRCSKSRLRRSENIGTQRDVPITFRRASRQHDASSGQVVRENRRRPKSLDWRVALGLDKLFRQKCAGLTLP